jgi:hypothetical protein
MHDTNNMSCNKINIVLILYILNKTIENMHVMYMNEYYIS